MNVKLVGGGIVFIIAAFVGQDMYFDAKDEEKFRQQSRSFKIDDKLRSEMKGLPLKVDLLNQYPNMFFYFTFTEPLEIKVENFESELQKIGCQTIQHLVSSDDTHYTKAAINVIQKDNITLTYVVKNYQYREIFKNRVELSSCSEFKTLQGKYA